MTQQWDPALKAASLTLSNVNLTASNSSTATYASDHGTEGFASGRYFWQVVLTFSDQAGAGYASYSDAGFPPTTYAAGNYLGIGPYSFAYFGNGGSVFGNSGSVLATLASFTSPCTVDCAIDFNSNLVWWRPSTGTGANLWNNAAIGSQNPAVGSQVGGIAIPNSMLTDGAVNSVPQAIYPGFTLQNSTDTAVARFAQATWTTSAPSGFGPFDPDVLMAQICM